MKKPTSLKLSGTLTSISNPSRNNSAGPELFNLDAGRKKDLTAFCKTVGIRFKSLELLNRSFIHRSVSNESSIKINNERLEFLGDAVLGAVTAALLYENLGNRNEGDLAKIKSVVVSEEILSGIARVLQIDNLLLLGKGEELSGGRGKKAILADALEALIGALYIDSGYKASFNFVGRLIAPEIENVVRKNKHLDYKSLLQELCQSLYRIYPVYRLVKRSGPEHARFFWMEVEIKKQIYGPGMGRTKKSAEQEAARQAYEALQRLAP